jgi:uncharacterized membrane protein (DUF2068 family)
LKVIEKAHLYIAVMMGEYFFMLRGQQFLPLSTIYLLFSHFALLRKDTYSFRIFGMASIRQMAV